MKSINDIAKSDAVLLLKNFTSLPVSEANRLRRLLDPAEVVVAKNSVIELAAARSELDFGELVGSHAVILVSIPCLPVVLRDLLAFSRQHPQITLERGFVAGVVHTPEALWALADPPLDTEELPDVDEGPSTFDVVLTDAGTKKIGVIKVVRELTSLGLKEAKDAVESVPFVLLEGATQEAADAMIDRLTAAGAKAAVR